MKKIISLILMLVLLTGCEATYNLQIDGDDISENINIYTTDMANINTPMSDYGDLSLKELFDMQQDSFYTVYYNDESYNPYEEEKQSNVKYYNQEAISTNSRYGMNYTYKFTSDDIVRSRAINTCYNTFTVNKSNNIYSLSTNNLAKCFKNYTLLDRLTINIKTSNRVMVQNADSVNNDTYTWIITKDNYNNKSIRLSYTTSNTNLEYNEQEPPKPPEEEKPTNPSTPQTPQTPSEDEEETSIYDLILVIAIIGLFIVGIIGFILYKGSTSKKY